MPRGGKREGAGRKSKPNQLSPRVIKEVQAKIRSDAIIKRLEGHIAGKVDMASSAVTAALGLLRKVIPDLASVTHSGQVELKRAVELTDDELAGIAAASGNRTTETSDDPPTLN